jgi:5-methylthioadenosine/S-adenosylhomocysteine deaminase
MNQPITKVLCARWVLPIAFPVIEDGAVAVRGDVIEAVGAASELRERYPDAAIDDFGEAAIMPGLINAHSHLELTAMRGFLDADDLNFTAWLEKLTRARADRMADDDVAVSVAWGVMEAIRAGVTTVGDASTNGLIAARVLRETGMRGTVYQESFGPDPRVARERLDQLRGILELLRAESSPLVTIGVSPHAPYSVSAPQLSLIAELALAEQLPLMMHAGESADETLFMRAGSGRFADGLRRRQIEWEVAGVSTIEHLERTGLLRAKPLLAHCITVDADDIALIKLSGSRIVHCPKSNAKLGHSVAPLADFVTNDLAVGLGSDSVASNNLCDLFEEARFALLQSRVRERGTDKAGLVDAGLMLSMMTLGGASALGIDDQVGSLEPGKQADLAVVNLADVHQQPVYDPATALIFASRASDVEMTMIAGNEVYRNGRFSSIDAHDLRTRLTMVRRKLASETV